MKIWSFAFFGLFAFAGCGTESTQSDLEYEQKDTVLVYTGTGAIQCEDSGLTLAESTQKLTSHGVDVLSSDCGYRTGIAVITVCGAGTVNIHIHKINAANVEDAAAVGFSPVTELEDPVAGTGYSVGACNE